MAIVIYQCDTCTREVELTRNLEGLEAIGRCVITDNCKGFLQQRSVKPETVNGRPPKSVLGLDDWIQRRVLHTHEQASPNDTWQVKHQLDSRPSIQIFVLVDSADGEELVEVDPIDITYIDGNQLLLTFSSSVKGICQCIARTSTFNVVQEYNDDQSVSGLDELIQVTTGLELTIATRVDLDAAQTMDLQLAFLSPADLSERPNIDPITFAGIRNIPESPWSPTQRVLIEGRLYQLRSSPVNLTNLLENGVESGNPFFFKTVDGVTPAPDEVYLMLTTSPFDAVDKNYDNIIDISIADGNNAASSFVYHERQLFAFGSVLKTLYPPVQITIA